MSENRRVRVSLWIESEPARIHAAFIDPAALTRFWLASADAPLALGRSVRWVFKVAGAHTDTTATRLDPPHTLEWDWSDGSHVRIELEPIAGGSAVTVLHDLAADIADPHAAALDATEGFAYVLADLKSWIESGTSAGITAGKTKLIELQR